MRAAIALAAALAAVSTALAADVLVMRDGSRVETEGHWKVQGKLVVFSLPGGHLASARVAEVDLEASAEATAEAQRPPSPPPAPAPRPAGPVLVLTDADVRHAPPPGPPTSGTAADAPEPDEDDAPFVAEWEETTSDLQEGLTIEGRIEHPGVNVAGDIRLTVHLLAADGSSFDSREADLLRNALTPGQSTRFKVNFPDTYSFSDLRFDVRSMPFRLAPTDPSSGEDTDGDGESTTTDASGETTP